METMPQRTINSTAFNDLTRSYLRYEPESVNYYSQLAQQSADGKSFLDQCLVLPRDRLSMAGLTPALGAMVADGRANAADVNRFHQYAFEKLLPVEDITMREYVDFVTHPKILKAFEGDAPGRDWHIGLAQKTLDERSGDYFAPQMGVLEETHNEKVKLLAAFNAKAAADQTEEPVARLAHGIAAKFWRAERSPATYFSASLERQLQDRLNAARHEVPVADQTQIVPSVEAAPLRVAGMG
jgi:hypothetical protein